MSVWEAVAARVATEEQPSPTEGQVTEEAVHDHAQVIAEGRARNARIQWLVDDYLTRKLPGRGSDVHVIPWLDPADIDSVVVIHLDRRWILWDRDDDGRFAYLTSDSIGDLVANGKIADRPSLPPVASVQFQIGEERISRALCKDLQRHNLI